MNWILRIYESPEDGFPMVTIKFLASTEVTAYKIAMNTVERDYAGCDWSLVADDDRA